MWGAPELFKAIIDCLVDATILYLIAQIDAGAETIQLFDSWAGAVPASLFEAAVIDPTARIVSAIKRQHPEIPIIGFPRAAGSQLARYAVATGVDAVGVDHMTDIQSAAVALPKRVALQGNLDPVALLVGGVTMENEARRLLTTMRGRHFVFNLGHGVLQQTPVENVATLVNLVKDAA